MARNPREHVEPEPREHAPSLPDELDRALEALWGGDSGKLDHLLGTASKGIDDESTIARMVRAAATLSDEAQSIIPPRDIDDFTIEGEIGRGGMGVVYRARQKHPERTVAIKLIRPGKLTSEHRRRFRFEADALASLAHPNIATIHQAGIHEINGEARPYIVMELVDGQALTAFARRHQLAARDRLQLFIQVCDAVQHAHQRGVLHRDLKPENILVSHQPADASRAHGQTLPAVKLLDFGVARPMDQRDHPDRPETADSSLIGTMLYMSPEQVAGETIDARSDVYSLGVVLYELLLERSPYNLASAAPSQIIEAIREQPPQFDNSARLDQDLQLILRKSMAKDRSQRYASADALAGDVRRFLRHEPIAARPPSAMYQLARLTRRNPLLVAGVSAFAMLLIAAVVAISILLVEAQTAKQAEAEQRRIAEREVEKQIAVQQFLQEMLSAADPRMGTGEQDVTVRQLVDRAAQSLRTGERSYDPEVEARVRDVIADVYTGLSMYEEAEQMFLASKTLRETHLEPDHPDHSLTLHNLGGLYYFLGDMDRAEAHFTEALALREQHFGEYDDHVATTLNNLAHVVTRRGDFQRALEMQQRVLDIRQRVLAPNHHHVAQAINNIGVTLHHLGRVDEARSRFEQALELREQIYGESHPEVAESLGNLGSAWLNLGELDRAEKAFRRCLDTMIDAYGSDHPALQTHYNNLVIVAANRQRYDEAIELNKKLLDILEGVYDPDHHTILLTRHNMSVLLSRSGRLDEAEAMLRNVMDLRRSIYPDDHVDLATNHNVLAQVLERMGRVEEAQEHFAQALDIRRAALGETHPDTLSSVDLLAGHLIGRQRFDDAERILLAAWDAIELAADARTPAVDTLRQRLIELYESSDQPETAERFRSESDGG